MANEERINGKKLKDDVMESKKGKALSIVLQYKVFIILIVICAAATIGSPHFLTTSNMFNVMRQISMQGMLAVGFTMVLASGHIDLSVGSAVGLIGVCTAMISKLGNGLPMPYITLVLISLVFGIIIGLINGFVIATLNVPAFVATLSTQTIMRGTIYVMTGNQHISGIPRELIYFGQGYIWGNTVPFPVILLIAVVIIGAIILRRTKFGRNMIAVGANRDAAHYCGISVKKTIYGAYIMTGLAAAMASLVLTGRSGTAQTGAGIGMEMDSIAAVVMGGTPMSGGYGNIVGSLGGSLIIGVISNMLNLMNVDSNWQYIVKGLLIVAAVLMDVQSTRIQDRMTDRATYTAATEESGHDPDDGGPDGSGPGIELPPADG